MCARTPWKVGHPWCRLSSAAGQPVTGHLCRLAGASDADAGVPSGPAAEEPGPRRGLLNLSPFSRSLPRGVPGAAGLILVETFDTTWKAEVD